MIALREELERRVSFGGVSWQTYQSLRSATENYHLRMTYDQGALEVVSPSRKHEQISYLIGRMIDQWSLVHKIDIAAGRNTTLSRQELDRGLEPDNCYWIRHEAAMRDKEDVDLRFDPPPDLAVEVDLTHSSVAKLPIYAALAVPEVWQWRLDDLQVLRLDAEGNYQPCKASSELARFPLAAAAKLLQQRVGKSDTAVVQEFVRLIKPKRRR